MEIEYSLTFGQLYRANLLLTYHRARNPLIIYFIAYFLYSYFTDGLLSFVISIPLTLIFCVLFSSFICFIIVNRNKHFIGKRTLVVTQEGYQYHGENFKREAKWSDKKRIWITPWYIYLDSKSLYPVILSSNALTDNYITHLKSVFG